MATSANNTRASLRCIAALKAQLTEVQVNSAVDTDPTENRPHLDEGAFTGPSRVLRHRGQESHLAFQVKYWGGMDGQVGLCIRQDLGRGEWLEWSSLKNRAPFVDEPSDVSEGEPEADDSSNFTKLDFCAELDELFEAGGGEVSPALSVMIGMIIDREFFTGVGAA